MLTASFGIVKITNEIFEPFKSKQKMGDLYDMFRNENGPVDETRIIIRSVSGRRQR